MAPTDDDVKYLWNAIDALRKEQSTANATLSRIEALLAERCANRGKSQDALAIRVDNCEHKIYFWSGVSATISLIAGYLLKLFGSNGQ